MKKSVLAFAIACSTLLAPSSIAEAGEKQKGFYLNLGAGYGQLLDIPIPHAQSGGRIKHDSGFSGDVGVGYDFGSIRTELGYNTVSSEVSTIQNKSSTMEAEFSTIQFTTFYDFRANKKWQPYVGAGIGSTEVNVKSTYSDPPLSLSSGKDTITSGVLKGGITYNMSDRIDVYGEAWWNIYDVFIIEGNSYIDAAMGGTTLGARIKF